MGSKNPTKVRSLLTIVLLAFLRVLSWVLRLLPARLWGPLATLLTFVAWHLLSKHRKRALTNLERCGLDRSQARKRGFASFRSCLLVMFESVVMDRVRERRGVRVRHEISPEAQAIIDRFKGGDVTSVILVGGHTGSWEIAGSESAMLLAPHPVVVSARLPQEPRVASYVTRLRNAWGLELIPKDVFLRQMIKRQRDGNRETYCFFCDQHFQRGNKFPFLGREACTVEMPAVLCHKYGFPILVADCTRKAPGNYVFRLSEFNTERFADLGKDEFIQTVTRELNAHISRVIDQAPEQWTWAHRRWRDCCGVPTEAPSSL